MTSICTVTGPLIDPTGALLINTPVTFVRVQEVGGTGTATVIGRDVTVQSDALGVIEVELLAGQYVARCRGTRGMFQFGVGVPDEATAALHDCIEQTPVITPGLVQQAVDARDLAKDYANKAEDSEVTPGFFSAFHWMRKARLWAIQSVGVPVADGMFSAFHWATQSANSAASAALSSAAAGTASARLVVATFPELATVIGYTGAGGRRPAAIGDYVFVLSINALVQVVDPAQPAHLNYTGSGGVKYNVMRGHDGWDVRHFGAVGNGVVDDAPAFVAARAAANGGKIRVPSGIYKLSSVLTGTTDLILEGDGASTVLDFSGAVSGGSYGLEAVGSATQIQNLGATASAGAMTVQFASAPSLTNGEVFVIFNSATSSWSTARPYYCAGEWCEVDSVSGNIVTLKSALYDTYTAAAVSVYKITSPRVDLRNFAIQGTLLAGLIRPVLCLSPVLENITARHANNSAAYLDRCFRPTVTNCDLRNFGDGGDDYGLAIGNCQHARVLGGNFFARRHAITHGGSAEVCSVPNRDCRTIGAVLKNDIGSGTFAADFHGNSEDCSMIDTTIYGGATWQGKDVGYVNCTIYADVGGRVIYSSEMKGGKFYAQRCKFITAVNPQPSGRAIVDVGGNSDVLDAVTVLPVTLELSDCELVGRNLSATTSLMIVNNRGTSQKINIIIDGMKGDVNLFGFLLRTQVVAGLGGVAASDFIIVDRIVGFPSGTPLHTAVGSAYLNFPHRLQRQTGTASLTATSGTNITSGTATAFRYPYPRVPHAQISGVGGFSGNVIAQGIIQALTATTLQPALISPTAVNWTATTTRNVYWAASLDEV